MSANVNFINLRDKIHAFSMYCEVNNTSHVSVFDFLLLVKHKAVVKWEENNVPNVIVLQFVFIAHTRLQLKKVNNTLHVIVLDFLHFLSHTQGYNEIRSK